jgi:hypothetical protein
VTHPATSAANSNRFTSNSQLRRLDNIAFASSG